MQPTGENGATRAPISIDLHRDGSQSSKTIILQIDNKSQQVSASKRRSLVVVLNVVLGLICCGVLLILGFCSDAGALRHSLQDRLSKAAAGKSRADEIYLNLRTSTGFILSSPFLQMEKSFF